MLLIQHTQLHLSLKKVFQDAEKQVGKIDSAVVTVPANFREAQRELALDANEGADILMVKPAEPYLDVIKHAKESFDLPIAAYQVSGEYSRLWAAHMQGWLDLDKCTLESLLSIKRAGADLIFTYFAERVSKLI